MLVPIERILKLECLSEADDKEAKLELEIELKHLINYYLKYKSLFLKLNEERKKTKIVCWVGAFTLIIFLAEPNSIGTLVAGIGVIALILGLISLKDTKRLFRAQEDYLNAKESLKSVGLEIAYDGYICYKGKILYTPIDSL